MRWTTVFGIGMVGVLAFSPVAGHAQTDNLAGNWNLETFAVEGTDFGVMAVQNNGITSVEETVERTLNGEAMTFVFNQVGKITPASSNTFVYAGGGSGTVGGALGNRVTATAAATGVIAPASNVIAGLWMEGQIFTKGVSTVDVLEASPVPFLMFKEGFRPESQNEAIDGEWTIEFGDQSATVDWAGSVTLSKYGTLIGQIGNRVLSNPDRPTAGIFTIDESGAFELHMTTNIEVPNVGVITITLSGSGQLSEDGTVIEGTWSFTVESDSDILFVKGAGRLDSIKPQVLEGDFRMTLKQASFVPVWNEMN